MLLGGGLVDALYPHILQNQANGGGGAEDAGLGQAVSPGEGEVLAGHGDGAFRQGGDVGGAGQAPDGDVLQGQVPEGAGVVVPVAAVIVIDQVVQMLEGAIPDHPILTVPPAQVVVEGVIG